MPPPRNGVVGSSSQKVWVCLRCQAQAQQRQSASVAVTEPGYRTSMDSRHLGSPDSDRRAVVGESVDGIRTQLRQWNTLHGHQSPVFGPASTYDVIAPDQVSNSISRHPDERIMLSQADEEDSTKARGYYDHRINEGDNDTIGQEMFLQMGDLVEIRMTGTEHESILAVFVRRVSGLAQCYTMSGRWINALQSYIPYSVPGWMSPRLLEPVLPYLPDAKVLEDREALWIQAQMEDLSVPRGVAAPIVERLVAFNAEVLNIYRKNANSLDAAHDVLAHHGDLRYGSLAAATMTLLNLSKDQLSASALFAVRRAISNAGFGFNIEGNTHRVTGYMQILPKEQVRLVARVREWIRQWQEDAAAVLRMSPKARARHAPTEGTQIINSYISKAQDIIRKSRETRSPTAHGTLGPSNVRLPMSKGGKCIRATRTPVFNTQEQEVTKFVEAWCVGGFFERHPRLASLPPLLLLATGLYDDFDLRTSTGFMFLQELGAYLPFDNRVRADANLLLPTSQHSRPLQVLESKLHYMSASEVGFVDAMSHLRHDWKDLPVYCIDSAGAKEIDDGLSVEPAELGPDGKQRYWVHVHVANPTAFFDKDNPVAKMARHMGETVYMPEKTFSMLPSWVSEKHFSLGEDRPCLTVSAKLDENGATLEHKITSGIVRNVVRMTPDEVNALFGVSRGSEASALVLSVGGEPPPPQTVSNKGVCRVNPEQLGNLEILRTLAEARLNLRKAAGGIFFDVPRPDVRVYETLSHPELAHTFPFRSGSRIVEGDPLIVFRTQAFRNWFTPLAGTADTLVREMMLLACETSAKWCAERDIPIIYRGTTHNPDGPTPDEFRRDVIIPQVGQDGEIPMHLGLRYMRTLGPSVLLTTPLRHEIIGMDHYSKVTSPLRRYGDMILHWQIQAALRHEAETGRSLVGRPDADRAFLPFSASMLDGIMRGLRPRERTVMLAKRRTERFWFLMLLMRQHTFGEDGGFPFKTLRIMATSDLLENGGQDQIVGLSLELNVYVEMLDPNRLGLGKAKLGDVWECEIHDIEVYYSKCKVTPLRLIERSGVQQNAL